MSPRRRKDRAVPLVQRLDALDRAVEVLEDVAPSGEVDSAHEIIERIDRRRALSAEHTVIGLFGATGASIGLPSEQVARLNTSGEGEGAL